MSTISRTIYFYRVDSGLKPTGEPISFDPIPILEHIDKLQFDFEGKYLSDINGRIICCWADSKQMPCKCRLGSIRRDDLPGVENQGEITALEIPERSGLVEQTHIVFLGNDIAGCDFNYYGPRISKFANYVADKAVGIAPSIVNFKPIIRRDIYKQLKKMKYLKMFQLKIHAPFAETIKDIDQNLAEAFEGAKKAGDADIIELILRQSRQSKGWLAEGLLETAQKLVRQQDIQYESYKFVVNGYDEEQEKVVTLDLLSDRLIIKKTIARMEVRSRTLSKTAAYAAIISAYNGSKEEILHSASLSI
jgi:hypothetical protein